jgi:predicted nucleic acid-binding protein
VDFERSGSLDVLQRLFRGRILVSDFVEHELNVTSITLPDAEVIALTSDEDWQFFIQLREGRPGLGLGETGAMAVARCKGATVLTNDSLARNCADEFGIPVSGAIGVLEYAIEIGEITAKEGVRILEDMIRAGAWISEDLVAMFRQRVSELG